MLGRGRVYLQQEARYPMSRKGPPPVALHMGEVSRSLVAGSTLPVGLAPEHVSLNLSDATLNLTEAGPRQRTMAGCFVRSFRALLLGELPIEPECHGPQPCATSCLHQRRRPWCAEVCEAAAQRAGRMS